MIPYWTNGRVVLWQGHVLDCLAAMEAGSVHCAVTSPPYWGLRDYNLPSLEWGPVSYAPMAGLPPLDIPGCDPECEHVWGEERVVITQPQRDNNGGLVNNRIDSRGEQSWTKGAAIESSHGQYCQLCGGWRGSLGLEPDPAMFVGHIVLVARELWRVLRDDATCWLNFGDSYAANRGNGASGMGPKQASNKGSLLGKLSVSPGLKEKDLIGIPWRVAFALQADGWFLRSDIIWAKGVSFCPTYSGSCMPESVRDRPTKGHEYVFLLSKNKRYFYDVEAVREKVGELTQRNSAFRGESTPYKNNVSFDNSADVEIRSSRGKGSLTGRNLRTVWTINPGSYTGAHFATFPPALVEPMIKAGTSAKGCCPECGSPWVRVTEKSGETPRDKMKQLGPAKIAQSPGRPATISANQGLNFAGGHGNGIRPVTTIGWTPSCSHYDDRYRSEFSQAKSARKRWQRQRSGNWWKRTRKRPGLDHWPVEPCTVLDPFAGTFTTGEVADFLGRHSVGIELSQKYCDDHIIPRLTEPLFEWAVQEQQEPEPEIEQLGLL